MNKGTGELLWLPRSGRLAGSEPNDHVLPACRLAGFQSNVLDDAVALVENSDHGDALGHRRHSALPCRGRRSLYPSELGRIVLTAPSARGQRECDEQRCGNLSHAYSGIQGS